MKRILSALLMLLLLSSFPARGEGALYDLIENALYHIVLRTEAGDTALGTGVLFVQQDMLLSTEVCCREGELIAIGADGEHAIRSWETVGNAGAALLQLADDAAAEPLFLSDYNAQPVSYLFGRDEFGDICTEPIYQVLYSVYRDELAMVLSSQEGLLPGAVMVDDRGQVVCLVVAQQMEGAGMYTALEAETIYSAVMAAEEEKSGLPLEMIWEDGLLVIRWQDDAPREGGLYLVSICAAQNSYYTTYSAAHTASHIRAALPPGQTYYAQVQWAESAARAAEPVWSALHVCTVPAEAFTAHGFTQSCYPASLPADTSVAAVLPENAWTAALLLDDRTDAYLQVLCSYDVAETIQYPLTASLTGPDGQFFFDEMVFTFNPAYESADAFAIPVDALFENCARFSGGTLLPGSYTLHYAIGGLLAGEYTFTLE